MILDFQEKLAEYVDELKLNIPLFFDTNDEDLSLSVYSLPGGKTVQSYMDGTKDKRLNYEFQGKASKEVRDFLSDALTQLSESLEELEPQAIKSDNDSFSFGRIDVTSEPYFETSTTDGSVYFKVTIQAEITIYKKEVKDYAKN